MLQVGTDVLDAGSKWWTGGNAEMIPEVEQTGMLIKLLKNIDKL